MGRQTKSKSRKSFIPTHIFSLKKIDTNIKHSKFSVAVANENMVKKKNKITPQWTTVEEKWPFALLRIVPFSQDRTVFQTFASKHWDIRAKLSWTRQEDCE